ncbi:MAG TPA: SDR family NAD(P)-dependent oxidoreductase, partial [Polyangiales bacterium]
GEVELDAERTSASDYGLHPALLDASLHLLAVSFDSEGDVRALLPFAWADVELYASGASVLRVVIRLADEGPDAYSASLSLFDEAGQRVATVGRLQLREATAAHVEASRAVEMRDLYQVTFQPVALASAPESAEGTWVLAGAGVIAERLGAPWVPDVPALQGLLDAGEAAPAQIVVDATGWSRSLVESERGSAASNELLPVLDEQTSVALGLLQGLLSEPRLGSSALVWLTAGAVAGRADDGVSDLAHAPVWGLVRSARSEHAERVLRLLDLDASELSRASLRDLLRANEEPELLWRDGKALAARLVVADRNEPNEQILPAPRELAPEGTVLITGGVGELGQALARHLVQRHGVRHLVLTSRRGLDTPGAAELVTSLQSLGAEQVRVLTCDVSERAELARVLASIDAAHPLTGVFHLAGVLDDGLLADLTSERLATVLRPKVHGGWHLHELTREQDLTAFVLFSSVAGVLGGAGQGNYAAANVFLDALAAERRARGLAGQSLAWGLWEPQGQGMTSKLGAAELLRIRRSGLAPLSLEYGMSLFDAAAQYPAAQLVPARLELGWMREQLGSEVVPPLLRALIKPSLRRVEATKVSASALRKRLALLPEGERLKLLLGMVQEVVARVLGLASPAAVPPNQPLKDLGLNSLMAVEVRNQLSVRAETKLPTTLVFDYPTPEAIAELMLRQASATHGASRERPSTRHVQMDEPIAVLAMACRAPGGVVDPESFWQLLAEGRDAVSAFPSRWDVEALYDPDPDAMGKTYAREGGFLADVDKFDAGFFGIAPREALSMDPQQRLVLEASWEALERAGLKPESLNETSTGV